MKLIVTKVGLGALLLTACLLSVVQAQQTAAQKYLISIERIWDRAQHNAFTDLVDFNGKLYCTFREGSAHVPSKEGMNGTIRVIVSDDGQNWRSVALLAEATYDLRDPKLSVTPDGRLMVVAGGSYYEGETRLHTKMWVAFSDKLGKSFGRVQQMIFDAKASAVAGWLWRVTWQRGIGYGVMYNSAPDRNDALLLSTRDGVHFQTVTRFDLQGAPNETVLRFLPNGNMVAWVRRERESQNGFIGVSRAPYTEWQWKEQPRRIGGPEFTVLPSGQLIGAARLYLPEGKTRTAVVSLTTDGKLEPLLMLPSAGDNSYAGMVLRGDKLLLSYYASHEGKTSIYLATLNAKALQQRE